MQFKQETSKFYTMNFADEAQSICKKYYHPPFPNQTERREVQRVSHGAQHVCRVAAWVRVLVNLYRKLGFDEAINLTEEDIILLQLVALFHDSARQDDTAEDFWEFKSAKNCYNYLLSLGIPQEKARRFSDLILYKENGGILGHILQSADCLDIMRCKPNFYIEKLAIYNDLKQYNQEHELINLVNEAAALIGQQHDLRDDLNVFLNGMLISRFDKTRDPSQPLLKAGYEHAENCYEKIVVDLKNFPSISELYNENSLITPNVAFNVQFIDEELSIVEHQRKILKPPRHPALIEGDIEEDFDDFIEKLALAEGEVNWQEAAQIFQTKYPNAWRYRQFILRNRYSPDGVFPAKDQYNYHFTSEADAKKNFAFYLLFFAEKGINLTQSCNSFIGYDNKTHPEMPYYFNLDAKVHEEFLKNRIPDSLVKSLRWDPLYFGEDCANTITPSTKQQFRPKLRKGNHKKFTTYAHGYEKRSEKHSPYLVSGQVANEEELALLKEILSVFQSTSLVTRDFQKDVFGHGAVRSQKLAGYIFDLEDALWSRLLIYDLGTVNRPYEAATEREALNYFLKKVVGSQGQKRVYYSSIDKLKNAVRNINQYTEILARIRFNINSSAVGIFSDSFEARCIAQYYAEITHENLTAQYEEMGKKLPENYRVPIVYYLPGHQKNWKIYKENEQRADRTQANRIARNKELRDKAFANNNFEFLLLLKNPDQILELTYEDMPVLQCILNQGLFRFAEILFERTTAHKERGESLVDFLVKNKRKEPLQHLPALAQGNTAIHYLAMQNRADYLPLFTDKQLEQCNLKGEKPLIFAAQENSVKVIDALIERGADPSAHPSRLPSPISRAILNQHLAATQKLFKQAPNFRDEGGATPLHMAVLLNDDSELGIVEYLINEAPHLINSVNNNKATPLDLAILHSKPKMLRLLLDADAEVSIQDSVGRTPLHRALLLAHSDKCFKTLLRYWPPLDIQDTLGATALHLAIGTPFPERAQDLINHGANVNLTDKKGRTPLHLAVLDPKPQYFNSLLNAKGIDLNLPDENGDTPLHLAIRTNNIERTKALLLAGAKADLLNKQGHSSYFEALSSNAELVKVCLEAGLSVEGSCVPFRELGKTQIHRLPPIFCAIAGNKLEIVDLLIKEGANLSDEEGSTALDCAKKLQRSEIANLFTDENYEINQQVRQQKALDLMINNFKEDDFSYFASFEPTFFYNAEEEKRALPKRKFDEEEECHYSPKRRRLNSSTLF